MKRKLFYFLSDLATELWMPEFLAGMLASLRYLKFFDECWDDEV